MKKEKRKYTRKVKPEAVQSNSRGLKYTDLPITLRKEIETILGMRKGLGLFDDTVERKERALRYQEFRNESTK